MVTVGKRQARVARGMAGRARRRDRRVYLVSHPVIFALLAATRRRAVTRLGGVVLIQGTEAFREALTRLPLDRTARGTTGGLAHAAVEDGTLFDQDGPTHRKARRWLAPDLSAAGVERLRPVWRAVLARRLTVLCAGGDVDMVQVSAELAGATVCALLGLNADPIAVARAAGAVAAAATSEHVPGIHRPGANRALAAATDHLLRLVRTRQPDVTGTSLMLAIAAVNTTVAGIPRAVAWCADCRMWQDADSAERREVLVSELLRVTAPTALLPRVAAGAGAIGGYEIRKGDRLILVARHAAAGHRTGPDCDLPAPPQVAQLVFGAGPHACPGAALARAQLADTLQMLAPHRPMVVRAGADRRSGLPSWRSLVIRATRQAEGSCD